MISSQDIWEQKRETRKILQKAEKEKKKPIRKLDSLSVRYIVKEKKKSTLNEIIARNLDISIRHVQRIWKLFKNHKINDIFYFPKKPGRHAGSEPGRKEHSTLIDILKSAPRNAQTVYNHLKNICYIPRDAVHKLLLAENYASKHRGRKRQCKYLRYERHHSNTLWHTDYTQLSNKKWLIMYIDDSSRLIVGWGIFDHATSHKAVLVFEKACKKYGMPYSVITDHGTQFYAVESEKKEKGYTEFEQHLMEKDVKHILARVSHPQTNGKVERVFKEYKYKIKHFEDVAGTPGIGAPINPPMTRLEPTDRFVEYHNNHPHRSLDYQTPMNAYKIRKIPKEKSHQDDV